MGGNVMGQCERTPSALRRSLSNPYAMYEKFLVPTSIEVMDRRAREES